MRSPTTARLCAWARTRRQLRSNLGIALAREGDKSGAAREFQAALALSPGSPEVLQNLKLLGRQRRSSRVNGQPYSSSSMIEPTKQEKDLEERFSFAWSEYREIIPLHRNSSWAGSRRCRSSSSAEKNSSTPAAGSAATAAGLSRPEFGLRVRLQRDHGRGAEAQPGAVLELPRRAQVDLRPQRPRRVRRGLQHRGDPPPPASEARGRTPRRRAEDGRNDDRVGLRLRRQRALSPLGRSAAALGHLPNSAAPRAGAGQAPDRLAQSLRASAHRQDYLVLLRERTFRHVEAMVFDQLLPSTSNYWTREQVLALVAGLPVRVTHMTHTHGVSWTLIAEKTNES